MADLVGVVMAAGEGRRMRSRIPKPLHRVCGREMVRYAVDLVRGAGAGRVVVVVSPGNEAAIRGVLGDEVEYAVQARRDGTAGALACCAGLLRGTAERALVVGSDSPLVTAESVGRLLARHSAGLAAMSLLAAPDVGAAGLGRVLMGPDGRVGGIVEAADYGGMADDGADAGAASAINDRDAAVGDRAGMVNAGVYCFEGDWVWEALERVGAGASGERYLTALAGIGAGDGAGVLAAEVVDAAEAFGVNDRVQLAIVEEVMRHRIRERWLLEGVTMTDPGSVYIEADAVLGMDTVLLPNCMLLGRTSVGEGCEIGPNTVLRDSAVGSHCRVTASMLEGAVMEDHTDIGPFSHLRPGAYLESGVHIGNYVEVKESRFKAGAVMGHFGYAGDATIGAGVNVGAGMVTCNYDGREKHRTVVGDGAFIGCDTMLVAPVSVGAGAVTGAGAVVTRDVPPGRLAVGVPAIIRREVG